MSAVEIDLRGPVARVIERPSLAPRLRALLRLTPAKCVYMSSLAVYVAAGAVLVFRFGSVMGDALSRAANGSYVLQGRDPHVAAIGFDWMPLPSVAMLPFLALRPLWPAVASEGFAANLASACCMAGAVVLLHGILEDFGLAARSRLMMTALFALHPMILYYGANGMSEASMLCALIAGTRPLLRWLHDDNPAHLMPAGIALGVAYLARYEALLAGLSAIALVAVVSWKRASRTRALADAAVIGLPIAGAFVLWAFTRWLIMGSMFMSYGQVYGSKSDVAHLQAEFARVVGAHGAAAFEIYRLKQTAMLAPLLPLALIIALAFTWRRRDARVFGILAVFASVLAFQDAFFITGGSYGWLRFSITAIPLLWLCAALPLAGRCQLARPGTLLRRIGRRIVNAALIAVSFTLIAPAYPTAARALTDRRLAREEAPQLAAIGTALREGMRTGALRRWDNDRLVARTIDAMRLPHGSVLMDATDGFAIALASRAPEAFIITPDRDFRPALADPELWGVRYLLVAPTPNHVIERTYPHMYDTGAGISHLVRSFPAHNGGYAWRLYRVDKARNTAG
jgi:hypothetical protein